MSKYVLSDKSPYSCAVEGCKKEAQKRQGILIHIQKAHKDILDQEVKEDNQNSEDIGNATYTKEILDVESHDTSEFDQDDTLDTSGDNTEDTTEDDSDNTTEGTTQDAIEDAIQNTTENSTEDITIKHEFDSNDHKMDTNEDDMKVCVDSHLENLDWDFLKELNAMKYPDMKITCLGSSVNCHRWILDKNSPVFDKIFSNEDFEKTRVMNIEPKDLKPTIEVLRFIYKGIINSSVHAYIGAYMYQVQEMIDKYQDSLNQILSVAPAATRNKKQTFS